MYDLRVLPKWAFIRRHRAKKLMMQHIPQLDSPWVMEAAGAELQVGICLNALGMKWEDIQHLREGDDIDVRG